MELEQSLFILFWGEKALKLNILNFHAVQI